MYKLVHPRSKRYFGSHRGWIFIFVTILIWVELLISWGKFLTNQKYYPDLDSDEVSLTTGVYKPVHVQLTSWIEIPWQNSGFVKSLEICSAIFQNMKKVWKMEIKSGKIVENLQFFSFFSKLQQLVLYKWFFFVLVKSYSISLVCLQPIISHEQSFFVPAFFKVSIDQWPIW